MRRLKGIWLGLFLLLAGAVSGAREGQPAVPNLQEAITAARDRVYPALVNIAVVMETVDGGRQVRHRGTGSGTILDAEGHVLTNHHVAGRATHVICTLSSKEEIPAEVVGTDAMTDLTVLKLKLAERRDPSAPLPVASLGDSNTLNVGDHVLAMGSPLGMARSVTLGIVSNKERPAALGDLEGEPTGVLTLWIQHDALINPGNSGGPLVNLKGEIVGINEAGTGTGVGFAIPSNLAKRVFAEILRQGHVRRGWLGAYFQPLLKGGADDRGALVSSVEPGSPAADAGLLTGDLLVAFDGTAITARFDEEVPLLYRRIAETPVGKVVELSIRREGSLRGLKVALGEDEPVRGQEHEFRPLGVTGRDITRAVARGLHLSDPSGVFLSGVQAGGSAGMAKPSLQGGDVLRSLDGKPVRNVQDLKAWMEALKPEEKHQVLAGVERRGAQILSVMTVAPRSEEARGPQVSKAWLGCATQVLTRPLGEALALTEVKGGVRVTQVYPETPAEQAGLRVGDVITQVGDKPVNASQEGHAEVFGEMIRRCRIGEKTALKVLRGAETLDVAVVLGASPVEPKDAPRMRDGDFEFVAREITFADRVWHRWNKDVSGCVVEGVEPSGWAGFAGLNGGDLILSVGGRPVSGLDSLKQVLEALKKEKPSRVVIMFQRGLHTGYLSVEPQWAE